MVFSHVGAINAATWAHPKYGSIIATAGQDGFIKIWAEEHGTWKLTHEENVLSSV